MISPKQAARLVLPPILIAALRRVFRPSALEYRGNYASWKQAVSAAEGYHAAVILATQLESARKVRDGLAVYERDSVLFEEIEYSFPVLAALLYVASSNDNVLTVLDFGGALGSSYYQNRGMLAHLTHLRWCVVEQPHFVAAGKAEFEDKHLRFYRTVEECIEMEAPNVVLFSSVLQYLEAPMELLATLAEQSFPFVLIDRTPMMDEGSERIVVQTVPPTIYPASYACRLFQRGSIEASLADRYHLHFSFEAHIGTAITLSDATAHYRGSFFERRDLKLGT